MHEHLFGRLTLWQRLEGIKMILDLEGIPFDVEEAYLKEKRAIAEQRVAAKLFFKRGVSALFVAALLVQGGYGILCHMATPGQLLPLEGWRLLLLVFVDLGAALFLSVMFTLCLHPDWLSTE